MPSDLTQYGNQLVSVAITVFTVLIILFAMDYVAGPNGLNITDTGLLSIVDNTITKSGSVVNIFLTVLLIGAIILIIQWVRSKTGGMT